MFPKLKFCGEEGELKDAFDDISLTLNEDVLAKTAKLPVEYDSVTEEDLFVWVDPLDGTKEYTKGYECAHEVTVLIGVALNGKPIAGVLNQPFYAKIGDSDDWKSRIVWGVAGLGAFDMKNELVTELKPTPKADSEVKRIVTTRSHLTDTIKRDLGSIPNSTLVHYGGAGYKCLSVIDQDTDCYIYPRAGTKRWDTCGPEAIVRALNGTLTDIYGNDYSYLKNESTSVENYYGLIASLKADNKPYLSYISEDLKELVKKDSEKFSKN
jgi:3'(2'), 5'-bisphosphate nucleotidase